MTKPDSLRRPFLSALALAMVACGSSGSDNPGIDESDAAGMDAPEVEGSTTCPARSSVVPGAACAFDPLLPPGISESCPTDHPQTCCGMTGTGSGFDMYCMCKGGVWSSCDYSLCSIVCPFDAGTNDAGDSGQPGDAALGDAAPTDSGASDASTTDANSDL